MSSMSRTELTERRREFIDAIKWSYFRHIGWTPHRYQVVMHGSKSRTRSSVAGRRGGKSAWSGHEGSVYMSAGPYKVWVVAESYDYGYNEFEVIRDDLRIPGGPAEIADIDDSKESGRLHIWTDIGSELEVISLGVEKSGHGQEVDLMILAESALMRRIGGESGKWNRMLRGCLASRVGDVINPTTPRGEDEFIFPMFMKGLSNDDPLRKYYNCEDRLLYDPDFASLNWPSWANRTGFREDVFKLRKELSPRVFDEQYRGLFINWSGSIWTNDFSFDPAVHVISPIKVQPWWNRIEVIDPGYSGMFVWIAAVIDENGIIYIVDEYAKNLTLFKDHVKDIRIKRQLFYAQHGMNVDLSQIVIPVYVDPESPRARVELAELGLMTVEASKTGGHKLNDVMAGFQAGGSRFANGRLFLFDTCIDTKSALMNHSWADKSDDGSRQREADDRWKHWSDCVRYINLAAIYPSVAPAKSVPDNTVGDLFGMIDRRSRSLLDYDLSDLRRLHMR